METMPYKYFGLRRKKIGTFQQTQAPASPLPCAMIPNIPGVPFLFPSFSTTSSDGLCGPQKFIYKNEKTRLTFPKYFATVVNSHYT